jgi:FMN phosphatase YigB (HAD superfamily)
MIKMKPTIFCDIDGTLVKHAPLQDSCKDTHKLELLPGTIEKLSEWEMSGYRIILTTGRKESSRKQTEKQLSEVGISYDLLIMGIGGGSRYLINDKKPDGTITSFSFCIDRNKGISEIDIQDN